MGEGVEGDPSGRLEDALSKALSYLSKRDRTESQVRHRLSVAGVEEATADQAVERLCELGYVDDERFAHTYAEDRRTLDGCGAERIEQGLRAAGIPADIATGAALSRDREGELSGALEVLDRRLPGPPADDRERERALGLLVRRGYELELAYDAIRAFERNAA
ncbi:MAG: regulatory protein RecX [Solirubrobacterales bacterium]